jgi:hypothetical protein
MIQFLVGILLGVGGMFYLSILRSKKYKEEKARIENEYENKVKSIVVERDTKIAELEASKKRIEELSAEEAKLRLSLKAQESIKTSNTQVIDSITSSVMDEIKKRANP